ncbi:unnamed protein product, partial [Dracunculus medinensis]|uniref:G_PROTEIN_RECEP_F1_2 domain-containing protein n=1 Tax=Dracunculus medinensis TaxID=318479 RepID=A0A0N4U9N5_DRAME
SISSCNTINSEYCRFNAVDLFVFIGLESLGITAILGNISLIIVFVKNNYINKASFILILSLSVADLLHGVVTTFYFYPPIIFKRHQFSSFIMRIFNIVDWVAWSITLTHMSAICIDRLFAVTMYGQYATLITAKRVQIYSIMCWLIFSSINLVFFIFNFCCIIAPLKEHDYYSFGYLNGNGYNIYILIYSPIEAITIFILAITNPITLIQIYKRWKRRLALHNDIPSFLLYDLSNEEEQILNINRNSFWTYIKRKFSNPRKQLILASAMLIEMSIKMGSQFITTQNIKEFTIRKKINRQQQRVMMQV